MTEGGIEVEVAVEAEARAPEERIVEIGTEITEERKEDQGIEISY